MNFAQAHNDYLDPDKNGVNEAQTVTVDIDESYVVSTGRDTIYFDAIKGDEGWFMGATVDSDTGHFCDTLVAADGPYGSEKEALQAGLNTAIAWFHLNNASTFEVCKRTQVALDVTKRGVPRRRKR